MSATPTQSAAPCATPQAACEALAARLEPVECESVELASAAGRITARPIVADRPSPPSDVSAMDGYAVRAEDVPGGRFEVMASILPGRPAPSLQITGAVRIMTGAVVPPGADAVIRREDVEEHEDYVLVRQGLTVRPGQHIRRRAENLAAGATVVEAGVAVGPSVATALASFGVAQVDVHRRVRVAVIVTGDELLDAAEPAQPWQIRDSNGPALASLLSGCAWIEFLGRRRVADEYDRLLDAIRQALAGSDALFVTGGVSAGTHDFVPAALQEAGCQIIFHKLPLRPGHPVLGAVGPDGQFVMGLPGNPLSVMTTARRIGLAGLRRRAGFGQVQEHRPVVNIVDDDGRSLHLWWYRPVRLIGPGQAQLVDSRGSGDVVCGARSDGFIEVPPNQPPRGPWPFYEWSAG